MYFDRVRFVSGGDECAFDAGAATEQPSSVSVYKTNALRWTFGNACLCAFGGWLVEFLLVVPYACKLTRYIEKEVHARNSGIEVGRGYM